MTNFAPVQQRLLTSLTKSPSGHPLRWGRPWLSRIPVLFAVGATITYWKWYASIGTGLCAVSVRELGAVITGCVCIWALVPAMASWEATASRSIRPSVTAAAAAIVAATALLPTLVYLGVAHLPRWAVPQAAFYDVSGYGLGDFWGESANALVIISIALAAIASLGAPAGTLITLGAYAGFFALSSQTTLGWPYAAVCLEARQPTWWAPTITFAAAVAIWHRTGGASRLAQRITR